MAFISYIFCCYLKLAKMLKIHIFIFFSSCKNTQVKSWVKELRRMLGTDVCLCIVGNKIDLEKSRHVTVQEAESSVVDFFCIKPQYRLRI